MNYEIRKSVPGDEEHLKTLWQRVFGDLETIIDNFFTTLYTPGMAQVCVCGNVIVSAAYVLKIGDLTSEGRWTPCREIYAYGTDPALRGRGFGDKVLRAAIAEAEKDGVAVLCPAEPSLFGYYEKYGFKPVFGVTQTRCTDVGIPLTGSATRITVRGYAALREELLHGRDHIDFDLKALEYQNLDCERSGGGFYYLVSDGARCCASVEKQGDWAVIRELIVPTGSIYNAAALAARTVGCGKFFYRTPVRQGEAGTPFAMLRADSSPAQSGTAWFGFSFD